MARCFHDEVIVIVALTGAGEIKQALMMGCALGILCFFLSTMLLGAAQDETAQDVAGPFLSRETLTGEWFGTRPALSDRGVEFFASYTAEVWGNTAGGLRTGSVYTGLLDFGSELDLEKIMGWHGAKASTTWLWLNGQDASQELVGNFLTISNIAGFNTLRCAELWLQQDLLDE